LPLAASENVPPVNAFANPPVPLVALVVIVYQPSLVPVMPPANVPMVHDLLTAALKLIAAPFVSGSVPESVQRVRLNGLPVVALTVSAPELLMESQPEPAEPLASNSCQL